MRWFLRYFGLACLLSVTCYGNMPSTEEINLSTSVDDNGSTNDEEYSYYYEDDENEAVVDSAGNVDDTESTLLQEMWRRQQELEKADNEMKFKGYFKNVGGGTKKISEKIRVEDLYLDETYDCVSATEISHTAATPDVLNDPISVQIQQARLSMREKQELRMQQLKTRESLKKQPKPKFRLGASCERLYCAACTIVVTEFAKVVHVKYDDPSVTYIHQIADNFCSSNFDEVNNTTYNAMVADFCIQFNKEFMGYKDALMVPFEQDEDLLNVLQPQSLHNKFNQICTSVGACERSFFEFSTEPANKFQSHWDDKCFVCQAFAENLQEQVLLNRYITEGNIIPIVAATCHRLNLPAPYDALCAPMTVGTLLDDIAWLGKVHVEAVLRKDKAEKGFADTVCEQIHYCVPWMDPMERQNEEAKQTMETAFE